ncbi:MAG TPA: glycerol-3-phosphate dehydrogenase/oxidase [Gemmatimonadales bacterium]
MPTLSRTTFDVAVIGGGIYGICALHEAARRGLSACLLERGDFVGATSSNSLKTIHGGLRYLQHADVGRMRESIRERARLLRVAPHLVRPLPFVLPTYGYGLHSRRVMQTALFLNDMIGFDRSAGAMSSRQIPRGRVIGAADIGKMVPGLDTRRLSGGAIWYDCQVSNTERLALSYLHSAVEAGADCANYVEVTGLLLERGRVQGVAARDRVTGDALEVRARTVVNAAGPWVDRMLKELPPPVSARRFHLSKAFNLVTRRLYGDQAIGFTVPTAFRDADALLNKGDRLFFVVPWKHFSLIGTRHLPYTGDADDFRITEDDIELFLEEINAACPGVDLARHDVIGVLGGMLPEEPRPGSSEVQLVKHSKVCDHASEGVEGLVSIVGVKWTTSRAAAEAAVDVVESRLHPGRPPSRPEEVPVRGGDIEDLDRFIRTEEAGRPAAVSPASMRHLLENYGTTARDILGYVHREPELGQPVGDGSPVIGAEVAFGVEQEMAHHLSDVVSRRTQLAAGGHPGRETLVRCADLMGTRLGWSRQRIETELDRTDSMLRGTTPVYSS